MGNAHALFPEGIKYVFKILGALGCAASLVPVQVQTDRSAAARWLGAEILGSFPQVYPCDFSFARQSAQIFLHILSIKYF